MKNRKQPAREEMSPTGQQALEEDKLDLVEMETEIEMEAEKYRELSEAEARGEAVQTYYNSLAIRSEADRLTLIRRLAHSSVNYLMWFMKQEKLTVEEAIKRANDRLQRTTPEELFDELRYMDVSDISWVSLDDLFRLEPAAEEAIWERLKEEAKLDFQSGSYAAQIFESVEWKRNPWRLARFLAMREEFIEQYKPQGGIELSMIDVLAVSFFLYIHWTEEHLHRATTEPRRESHEYQQWREGRKRVYISDGIKMGRGYSGQYLEGAWDIPYQNEAEAIEQAAQIADRFRRQYQSQLRAMRDWRRYGGPVIVQNAEQVNVAADGGQQVNVQKKGKSKKK